MKLRVYLAEKNMSVKKFAELLDINHCYASRISQGRVIPSKKLARHIERFTEGLVTFNLDEKKPAA